MYRVNLFILLFFTSLTSVSAQSKYDVNGDGSVDISDINAVISYICGNTKDDPVIPVDTTEHQYVDLGLPSGTLWAKTNMGAGHIYDYGNYFAWGEITGYSEGKSVFDLSHYRFYKKGQDADGLDLEGYTKYISASCADYAYDEVDNKTTLDSEDDAATANWGSEWSIPSIENWQELINCCTWKTATANGVKGWKVTGTNGNYIFLPLAGYRRDSNLNESGTMGYYRTNSKNANEYSNSNIMILSTANVTGLYTGFRYCGLPIRPVQVKDELNDVIYYVGTTGNWSFRQSGNQKLHLTDATKGIYEGFVYQTEESYGNMFKFVKELGDWSTAVSCSTVSGDAQYNETDDNIVATQGTGVYYISVNIADGSVTAKKIDYMSVIGDYNGWSGDVDGVWDTDNLCYIFSGTANFKDWKFRANHEWSINLGGDINDVVLNGYNFTVSGNSIKLYPCGTSTDGKIYCEIDTTSIDNPTKDSLTIDGTTVTLTNGDAVAGSDFVTLTVDDLGITDKSSVTDQTYSFSDGTTTVTLGQGDGKSGPTYYASSKGFRLYSGNTLTFSCTNKTIAMIVMECDCYNGTNYVGQTSATVSFSGNTAIYTNAGTGTTQLRVQKITIYYEAQTR